MPREILPTPNPSFKRKQTQKSIDPNKLREIRGFEFSPQMSVKEFVGYYQHMGFQASHLTQGMEIIKEAREDHCEIFLSCTSNMGSSGLRELIAQLIRDKKISCLITTTGLIEEDVIKTFNAFRLGEFDVSDEEVKANKLNRIGNIYVPDAHYVQFESWHNEFMQTLYKEKKIWPAHEYILRMGQKLKDEHSILYWAAKRGVPIIVPGFVDGAMGDHWYFFNQNKKPEERLIIDQTATLKVFYDQILAADKTCGVILGGGIAKHHLIGAAILRDGLDYAVYMGTGTPYDGSLSGAHPQEAISWNKLKERRHSAHIECEATIG
ncbi:MAG: deoxyhypusine synthase family protein, partial [archaeon]|nr:deoxyhypusine synthase family protein [archaeon]